MHSFEGLADEISTLLKNRGDTGDRGDKFEKANRNNVLAVTPCRASLSPLEFEGCHLVPSRGDGKGESNQSLAGCVTRVTPVTRDFEHGLKDVASDRLDKQSHSHRTEQKAPSDHLPVAWIDGVARLRTMDIPDCFSAERWRYMVDDADAFLKQWGVTAVNLGWSTHDLFGVHPAAPTARFDAMGLIPLLHGNPVIALTETTATLRGSSGSIQRFSRIHKVRGIYLWEIER